MSHKISLLKSITWRITGTLDTMLISYLITGSLKAATAIGTVEVVTKMGLYYIHERVWHRFMPYKSHQNPPAS